MGTRDHASIFPQHIIYLFLCWKFSPFVTHMTEKILRFSFLWMSISEVQISTESISLSMFYTYLPARVCFILFYSSIRPGFFLWEFDSKKIWVQTQVILYKFYFYTVWQLLFNYKVIFKQRDWEKYLLHDRRRKFCSGYIKKFLENCPNFWKIFLRYLFGLTEVRKMTSFKRRICKVNRI